jgi:hypothetical protein
MGHRICTSKRQQGTLGLHTQFVHGESRGMDAEAERALKFKRDAGRGLPSGTV